MSESAWGTAACPDVHQTLWVDCHSFYWAKNDPLKSCVLKILTFNSFNIKNISCLHVFADPKALRTIMGHCLLGSVTGTAEAIKTLQSWAAERKFWFSSVCRRSLKWIWSWCDSTGWLLKTWHRVSRVWQGVSNAFCGAWNTHFWLFWKRSDTRMWKCFFKVR